MVLALLDADGLRQLVVAGGDLVDDDPPLAVRVERPGNVVTKIREFVIRPAVPLALK